MLKTQSFRIGTIVIPTIRKIRLGLKDLWICRIRIQGWNLISSLFIMKKYQLGEFEEVVILTVGVLYKNAYGVAIKKEIESRLDRSVSMGAMHSALVRLEDKGYIKSHDGEATEERAGRPRKYFQITALGKRAIEYTKDTRDALWNDIPEVALQV